MSRSLFVPVPEIADLAIEPIASHNLNDPSLASSLLQKAIRRSHTKLALTAAQALYRLRGGRVWRRMIVIAFEDIGIGSMSAVSEAIWTATEAELRAASGGDLAALEELVRSMARASKNRATDLLVSAIHHHPDFAQLRKDMVLRPMAERIRMATDRSCSLYERAMAIWFASGLELDEACRVGPGAMKELFSAFAKSGVSSLDLELTAIGLRYTRELTVVMALLLWQEVGEPDLGSYDKVTLPMSTWVRGVPTYVLDKHTRLGKVAIRRLIQRNVEVCETFLKYVEPHRIYEAADMAAFYADAACLAMLYVWPQMAEIERLGFEADMVSAGVPLEGAQAVLAAMVAHIDELNAIRAELLERALPESSDG